MLGALNDSTILRLRVKGSDLDPLALRGRLQNVLSDVSLEPRLPPTATLFIRKISDPLPGSIQLDDPHARAPHAWRHAFQRRFDQLVSSAARPAHGLVADSVESVVFYSHAELLACLTADWCSGFAATRWWWQALIKRGDVSRMVRQLWREKIEYVPVALEFLVRKGVVVEFVSRLSDAEVREIFERVVQTFQVTRIARIKATDLPPQAVPVRETTSIRETNVKREMPWRDVVPESETPRLRPVQQFFVGVVLMIQRAPSRVRTESFAREVERWVQTVVYASPDVPEIVIEESRAVEFFNPPETHAPIRENPIPAPPEIPTRAPSPEGSVSSVVKIANAVFHYETPDVASEPLVESTSPPEPIVTVSAPLDAITFETELGGLFYLINLAIFMEIYSDFTSPVEQFHDDLSIWEFVRIVGDDINQHRDLADPVWTGIEDLQDVQDKNLVNPENHENPVNKPTWLADMLPHIKARLLLAFGLNDESPLPNLLIHHYARITITPTHLDVFFPLADHPIEIRLSGLDRNPGWVPAAGRFIAFHYD
jgi:hypothetical protein